MDPYQVFLSSPSDVLTERDRAEVVVKLLNAERVDQRQFEMVRWELDYYTAQSDFQSQIKRPSECDIAVCIFWKRLGSDLPPKYARADGTLPTGTEYEFEDALQAAAGNPAKLPDVLVYRKTADVTFSAATVDLERAQYDRFMAFWQRWFRNEKGHFLAGFQTFATPDEFAAVFERNLRTWLRDRETQVTWTQGSPYRGLEPFDVQHASIFFGRRREVERARARLIASAIGGRPFLLISGPSGSGKSSLARAGLIPRLAQAGGLSTLAAALRWTIFTPGQVAGDWPNRIASRLLDPGVLGDELRAGDFNSEQALGGQLARADAQAGVPLVGALRRAGAKLAAADRREQSPKIALLLLIDQFEELFAWPRDEATLFVNLMAELAKLPDSPIIIVATMRSDFQHRLAEFPALAALTGRSELKGPFEGEQTLELNLPSAADLREMILGPGRAAGLIFEIAGDRDLAHLIESEARPEAMPSIQFLLSELYAARADRVLTLAAFDALGGVSGVMATRGEAVNQVLDLGAREAFPRVVRALVTQIRSDVPASARRVPESTFSGDEPAQRLIGALRDARLIISDRGELRFAHDSLLSGWTRLKDQIAQDQRLLEVRDRLERDCARWVGAGRNKYFLVDFELAEGRELLAKWSEASLTDNQLELPAYIKASDVRETRARRRAQFVAWSIAGLFAFFSVLLFVFWRQTAEAQRQTQASLWIAESQALLDRNVLAALDRARRAFFSVPTEQSRSTLLSALMEVSPHLVGTSSLGGDTSTALAWTDDSTLTFATGSGQVHALTLQPGVRVQQSPTWNVLMPPREGGLGRAYVRSLRAIAPDRLIAVLADGAIGVLQRDAKEPRLQVLASDLSPNAAGDAVAIGPQGALIAIAATDRRAILYRCDWERAANPCRPPESMQTAPASAVAISRDGTMIAAADSGGMVALVRGDGTRKEFDRIEGSIVTLRWASDRDWLAVGTAEGKLVIFDAGSDSGSPIETADVGARPVSALAWHPKEPALAFVCSGADAASICIWRAESDGAGQRFKPPLHLDGHSNSIIRIAWAPDGRHLASSDVDGAIRFWSLSQNTDARHFLLASQDGKLTAITVAPDGAVWAGASDGAVHQWEATDASDSRILRTQAKSEVQALALSRSGALAALHENHTLTVLEPGAPPREIALHSLGPGSRLAWVEDGRVAVPLQDGKTALVDASRSSGQLKLLEREVTDRAASASGIAADPGKRLLFVTHTNNETVVWDLSTAKATPMQETRRDRITNVGALGLAVSPDGRWLATSSPDRFVPVYDIDRRASSHSLETDSSETVSVAFNPTGRRLAALGADNRLYVWEFNADATSRIIAVNAVPGRAAIGNDFRPAERASWVAWVSDDRLALVTGIGSVTVLQLNPDGWKQRLDRLLPP